MDRQIDITDRQIDIIDRQIDIIDRQIDIIDRQIDKLPGEGYLFNIAVLPVDGGVTNLNEFGCDFNLA